MHAIGDLDSRILPRLRTFARRWLRILKSWCSKVCFYKGKCRFMNALPEPDFRYSQSNRRFILREGNMSNKNPSAKLG